MIYYVSENGVKRPATEAEAAEIEALKAGLKPAEMTEAERIAELETRLARYEDNERATNILLGVSE